MEEENTNSDSRSVGGFWDGNRSPDLLPDRKWETWAVQFVADEKLKEAADLVVSRLEDGSDLWVRVGIYTLMPPENPNADSPSEVGEMKMIMLV
jgi:hypothetical protein